MELDDNPTYEAFQFWWYALANAEPKGPPERLELEERLRWKLVAVSEAHAGGGRRLTRPCRIEFTGPEVLALLERIAECSWTPEAKPHAEAAGVLLASRAA